MKRIVTIRFFVPFAGKDRLELQVPISDDENLITIFSRLEDQLNREFDEKILENSHFRYVVAINGRIISEDEALHRKLWGNEVVTVFAPLFGG